MMWIKWLVVAFLAIIIYNLGAALYYMMRDRGRSERTLIKLKWRVGLSIVFVLVLIALRVTGVLPGNPDPITGQRTGISTGP